MTASERRALAVGLGIGALVAGLYLAVGVHYRPGGGLALHLRDALLFHQYAASLAQGAPYAFIPGDPPSTGSTSHLYPLVLALFYALGARGDALGVAGCGLAAASHLASIALLWAIARRLAPRALPLAVVLCATSGHLALSLFDQTDAVVSVPLALGALAALVHERTGWLRLCLVLLSLARPDGFALSLALLAVLPWSPLSAGRRRSLALSAGLGLAAFAATLALNQLLTGSAVPHSVQGKGLFHEYSAVGALHLAARAVGGLFVELGLGIGDDTRRMFLLPLVGAALALCGFVSRAREGAVFERCYPIATLLVVGLGIVAGTSGVHRDRYLAWVLPVVPIYAAAGLWVVSERLHAPALARWGGAALVAFQLAGAAYLISAFAQGSATTASNVRFVKRLAQELPEETRLGVASAAGLAYFLAPRHVTHVNGIVSPAFAHPHPNVVGAEILKHRPELRFDAWLVRPASLRNAWYRPFVGRLRSAEAQEVSGASALGLFEADWSTLVWPDPSELRFSLDVGHPEGEALAGYRSEARLPGTRIEPTLVTGRLGGRVVSDVGRIVRGRESFRAPADALRAGPLVLRTAWRADALVRAGANTQVQRFHTATPLALSVRIDGQPAQRFELPLEASPERLQELPIPLRLSGSSAESVRIEIEGDYLSLGYLVREP